MAESTPINIQIDQEALRAQIRQVIREETQELAMALMRASYAVAPEWHDEHFVAREPSEEGTGR